MDTTDSSISKDPEDDLLKPSWAARALRWLLGAMVLGTPTTIVIAVAVAINGADDSKDLRDILALILAWPFLLWLLLLVAGVRFQRELGDLLNNLAWFKIGPVEGRRRDQIQPPPPAVVDGGPTPTPETEPQAAPGEAQPTPAGDTEQLAAEVIGWRDQAFYWWYQYLDAFLVPSTKALFEWLSRQQVPPTKTHLIEFWRLLIPNPVAREQSLEVLWHFGLVEHNPERLALTDHGRGFLTQLDRSDPSWRVKVWDIWKNPPTPPPPTST